MICRVYVHSFFPDVLERYAVTYRHLFHSADSILISSPIEVGLANRAAMRAYSEKAQELLVQNSGRDIAGIARLVSAFPPNDADTCFILHTKKSAHLERSESLSWTQKLLGPLIADENKMRSTQNLVDAGQGLVVAKSMLRSELARNWPRFYAFCGLHGLHAARGSVYLSGSMYAASGRFMKDWAAIVCRHKFLPSNNMSVRELQDGQVEHALERIFLRFAFDRRFSVSAV